MRRPHNPPYRAQRREPPAPTFEIEIASEAIGHVETALRHVAREVFDYDQYMMESEVGTTDGPTREQWDFNEDMRRTHELLYTAGTTIGKATSTGRTATARLTQAQIEKIPEALAHVRDAVFDRRGRENDLILDFQNACEEFLARDAAPRR